MSQPEDQSQYLLEITEDVGVELFQRLDADPSERDRVAMITAIQKASARGFLRGMAMMSDEDNMPVISGEAEIDLWASKYGGDDA